MEEAVSYVLVTIAVLSRNDTSDLWEDDGTMRLIFRTADDAVATLVRWSNMFGRRKFLHAITRISPFGGDPGKPVITDPIPYWSFVDRRVGLADRRQARP